MPTTSHIPPTIARLQRLGLFCSKTALLAFSLLAAFAVPVQSSAQPGVLDSTFGTGGKLTYAQLNLSAYREGTDVAIQSDQKILISTRGSGVADIVRLNPNGTPDASFGVGGVASAGVAGRSVGIFGIAVQSDGKIVVAGGSRPHGTNASYVIVMRFDAAGALDTSFGTGGLTQTAVLGFDYARRVKIQPDGRIVVAVNAETGNGSTVDFAVLRYTAAGSLDTGFGGGGIKIIPVSAGADSTTGLALQSDGKIIVTGRANLAIATGGVSSEVGVARLTADGSLDASFGTGGSGIVRLIPVAGPNGVQSSGQSVGVQSDGKIVIGGYAGSAGSNASVPYSTNLVLRLNSNGTLDSGFGSGGVVTTEVADNQVWPSLAYDLALLPDGRIAVAGIARGDFSLVVYRANGSLDATFGTAGIADLVNFASSYDRALAIAVQADGKFVLVGTVDVNAVALAVARYGAVTPSLSFPAPTSNQSWAGTQLAFGDLNRDGRVDIVSTKSPAGAFAIAYNNGNGTFTESIVVGNSVSRAFIVDVNEDGRPDIVTIGLSPFGHSLTVYLNTVAGFVPQFGYPFPGLHETSAYFPYDYQPIALDAGRTTGPGGKIDLVVTSIYGKPILVFRGNGDGSFQPNPVQIPNPTAVTYGSRVVKLADLDGDGYPDIVTTGGDGTYWFKVWRNDGTGNFPAVANFTAPVPTTYHIVGDLKLIDMNRDGRPDVVFTTGDGENGWVGRVRWYENTGALTNFLPRVAFTGQGTRADGNGGFMTDWYIRLADQDLDRDGNVDLVATTHNGVPAILRNNGDGTFSRVSEAPRSSPTVPYAFVDYVYLADITGTGVPTLLGGKANNNAGIVYGALLGAPAPVVAKPVVSNAGITRGYGDTVSYTLVATNSPTSYAATNLPAGLTLNPTTGLLSGTVPMVLGDYTINVSATNAGGTGTATVSLRVIDFTRPVITAPSTLQAEATSAAGAVITFSATAQDVISGSVAVTATPPSGSTIGLGTSLIQLSARDGSNNIATRQIVVTVRDTTKPVLTLPASITLEATSAAGAVATFSASASDLVAGALPVTTSPASGATFAVGTTTVNASATDGFNNTATGTFSVTVTDTTAPVITVPANLVVEATGAAGAVVNYVASATDLVSGAVAVSASRASGSTFALGTTTVTLTAADGAGNIATETFSVTVSDTTAPVIVPQNNLVVEATSAAGAVVSFTPSALDGVSGAIAVTASPASGSTFAIGATTVTLTATDAANNTTTRTFTVTVRDTTAPVIAVPANIVAEATSANGAAVSFTTSATDLVSGAVTVSASKVSGSAFPIGATTVTLTATDAHGNTSTASFTVTVRDTTAPALTLPANQVLEANGPTGAVAVFTPTAADAVGVNSLTISAASGATFALGITTINVVATDAAGNATNGAFTITVRDTTAPTIVVPANLVLNSTSAAGAVATFAASANDLVSGAVAVTLSPASGSVFAIGTTTVTARSTDAAGNSGTRTFTVTVLSPSQQLANLIAVVNATPGLSAGEVAALTAKLDAAVASLARGNVNAAKGQIGAFVNQVGAFTHGKTPRLSAGQAQTLITAAQAISNQL